MYMKTKGGRGKLRNEAGMYVKTKVVSWGLGARGNYEF
jgi:hypothetical protein